MVPMAGILTGFERAYFPLSRLAAAPIVLLASSHSSRSSDLHAICADFGVTVILIETPLTE
eukprot:4912801-Pleurochrysis_carterae.AAC.1